VKKFVYLFIGSGNSEAAGDMQAWINWFGSIGEHIVDSGNPFSKGNEYTASGSKELDAGPDAITGYTIVNAESIEEAATFLKGCPMSDSVRVYECHPM
jgi:hypothetical protein